MTKLYEADLEYFDKAGIRQVVYTLLVLEEQYAMLEQIYLEKPKYVEKYIGKKQIGRMFKEMVDSLDSAGYTENYAKYIGDNATDKRIVIGAKYESKLGYINSITLYESYIQGEIYVEAVFQDIAKEMDRLEKQMEKYQEQYQNWTEYMDTLTYLFYKTEEFKNKFSDFGNLVRIDFITEIEQSRLYSR